MKYLLLIFCLVLCYCRDEAITGLCSNPPKLSKNELLFSAQGGVDSVVVSNPHWWLRVTYMGDGTMCESFGTINDPDYCNNNYCKGNAHDEVMKIECPWYSVTRTGGHTLIVSVSQNETGEERKQFEGVHAGNCGAGFSITQYAK